MRRGVEVTGQEGRDPGLDQGGQDVQALLDGRQTGRLLERDDLLRALAVADVVRAVRIGRQVDVRDGDDGPRGELDEGVAAVGAGGVDDRELRDQLVADVGMRPAELLGEATRVALGLLERDDIRIGEAGGLHDLGEVDLVAAVLDVEVHQLELRLRRRRRGRGTGWGRCRGLAGAGVVHASGFDVAEHAVSRITASSIATAERIEPPPLPTTLVVEAGQPADRAREGRHVVVAVPAGDQARSRAARRAR